MQLKITPCVKWIMIACGVMFVLQQTVDQYFDGNLLAWFGLIPVSFMNQFRVWQIFTYAFLHGDISHLILNILMLLFIGGEIEAVWGAKKFLRFYFFCSVAGGFAYLGLQLLSVRPESLHTPMVGASGAIYGLLMAYGLMFSERVLLFMMLFPMKARHFIWVLAGVEFMTTVFGSRSGVAGIAHLGGMAAGWIYLFGTAWWAVMKKHKAAGLSGAGLGAFKPKASSKKRPAGHLKLVVNREDPSKSEPGDDDPPPKVWH